MPLYAKEGGAKLAIINYSETSCDAYADVIIGEKAGTILPQLVNMIGRVA
jgi:NAD-dependent SIR2 family protein deacetylase